MSTTKSVQKAVDNLEKAVDVVIEKIETLEGEARPASKTKTLKENFKPQTEKREASKFPYTQAKTNSKPSGNKSSSYVSDAKEPEKQDKTASKKSTVSEPKKIIVKNKENPHAKGSKRAKHWDKLLASKTTDEFRDKGGRGNLLPAWVASGHIVLS